MKDGGVLTTLEPETGRPLKVGRLPNAFGSYFASPVAADGNVFLVSKDGVVSVVKAGAEWTPTSRTDLQEECFATPALDNGCIILRGEETVYCFGRA